MPRPTPCSRLTLLAAAASSQAHCAVGVDWGYVLIPVRVFESEGWGLGIEVLAAAVQVPP